MQALRTQAEMRACASPKKKKKMWQVSSTHTLEGKAHAKTTFKAEGGTLSCLHRGLQGCDFVHKFAFGLRSGGALLRHQRVLVQVLPGDVVALLGV